MRAEFESDGERRGERWGRLLGGGMEKRDEGRGCLPVLGFVDDSEFAGGGVAGGGRGSSYRCG